MSAPHNCTACSLCNTRTQVVNGIVVGDNPQLLVIGEGPGVMEDSKGQPFVGPTGALLKQELGIRGIHSYALSNATRCYPGEDKSDKAMREALEACNTYLLQDIAALQPKVILVLGAWAVRSLGFDDPMQTILAHVLEFQGIPAVVSYHPAAFMRDTGSLHLFELAVYKVMRLLNDLSVGREWPPQLISMQEFDAGRN